jgi:hypothetical protein
MLARKIEKWPFGGLLVSLVVVILLFATAFYFLSFYDEGIVATAGKPKEISFLDSLYFSIVTVSSLGYGDFRPEGLGRLFAVIEVILGLVIIALIVAKMASDRTATLVRLLYSSDSERRLKKFNKLIKARVVSLRKAKINNNHEKKADDVRRLGLIIINLANYYSYQVKVGALGEDWARKNSLRILRTITLSVEELSAIGKLQFTTNLEKKRIEVVFKNVTLALATILTSHRTQDSEALRDHIESTIRIYFKHRDEDRPYKGQIKVVTPYFLGRVKELLPNKPWPKHIHKKIASELRVSNRLVHKAITEMEENN